MAARGAGAAPRFSKPEEKVAAPNAGPARLTSEQVEKKLTDSLDEYNQVGDVKELLLCLTELSPRLPDGRTDSLGFSLFSIAMPKACDARTDAPRERLCELLAPLHKAGMLEPKELQTFFTDGLEFLEDETVDVPRVAFHYALFIAHAAAAELVPLAVLGSALLPLVDARLCKPDESIGGEVGAAFLLAEVLRQLKGLPSVGGAKAKTMYMSARLSDVVLSLLPEANRSDAAAAKLFTAAGIQDLDPQLTEAASKAEAAASAEAVRSQLEALETFLNKGILTPSAEDIAKETSASAGKEGKNGKEGKEGEEGEEERTDPVTDAKLDEISKWIDETLDPSLQSDDKVARAVMRAVLNAAVTKGEAPTAQRICMQIKRCSKLLKKCTQSTAAPIRLVKQAGCLYEVQAFCFAKEWPAGLMKKVFYNLYDTDVVFEDAYGVWREDVNDVTPGKDKALFQVNEFLSWLEEALEED